MKKYGFIFFISLIIILLQQAIFSRIVFFKTGFDAVFVFVICFSLLNPELECILLALLCGIMRDSFFPYVFGINTVIYLITAYILSQIAKRIYKDAIIIPVSLTMLFSMLKALLYFAFFYISSINFDFQTHVLSIMVAEAVMNAVISLFMYGFVKKIFKLSILNQDWKF